jgi:hypothetical protein
MPPIPLDPTDLKPGDKGPGSIPIYISSHVYHTKPAFSASAVLCIMAFLLITAIVLLLCAVNMKRRNTILKNRIRDIWAGKITARVTG